MSETNKLFVLSDENINRYGFKTMCVAFDLALFAKNPVMFYNHDRDKLIGRWDNVRVDGQRLLGEPDFDIGDEFARDIKRKVDSGYLRAASIGMRILDMQRVGDEMVVTKADLIEVSIVDIPANANSVRLYEEDDTQGLVLLGLGDSMKKIKIFESESCMNKKAEQSDSILELSELKQVLEGGFKRMEQVLENSLNTLNKDVLAKIDLLYGETKKSAGEPKAEQGNESLEQKVEQLGQLVKNLKQSQLSVSDILKGFSEQNAKNLSQPVSGEKDLPLGVRVGMYLAKTHKTEEGSN